MTGRLILIFLVAAVGCSSPKYTYYFPQVPAVDARDQRVVRHATLPAQKEMLTASTEVGHLQTAEKLPAREAKEAKRKPLPVINGPVAQTDAGPSPVSSVDQDAKLGAIFFLSGVVVYIIGSPVFTVVGSLAMLIGIIFGIKWLLKQ